MPFWEGQYSAEYGAYTPLGATVTPHIRHNNTRRNDAERQSCRCPAFLQCDAIDSAIGIERKRGCRSSDGAVLSTDSTVGPNICSVGVSTRGYVASKPTIVRTRQNNKATQLSVVSTHTSEASSTNSRPGPYYRHGLIPS